MRHKMFKNLNSRGKNAVSVLLFIAIVTVMMMVTVCTPPVVDGNGTDTTIPSVGFTAPATSPITITTNGYLFTGVASDNEAIEGVYFSRNGSAFNKISSTITWSNNVSNLAEGTNTVNVYAKDTSGNTSVTQSVVVVVDTVCAPIVSVSPPGSINTNQVFTINISVNTNYGYWSTNGNSNFNQLAQGNTNILISTNTTLWYYGDDGAGHTSSTQSVVVVVDTNMVIVNTNSPFYAADGITFTGDPATDFGANRVLIADPGDDSISANGAATKKYHELTNIYFAIDNYKIYFGHKTPAWADGTTDSLLYNAALYLFIDNGLDSGDYSSGIVDVNDAGLVDAGISGNFGSFEQLEITLTNQPVAQSRKVSYFFKHYRPQADSVQSYRVATGAVDHLSGAGFTWDVVTAEGVTEVAIPISYLFGDITEMSNFYVAFRIDDAFTADAMGKGSEADATAIDWAPEQAASGAEVYGFDLTNWITITNL